MKIHMSRRIIALALAFFMVIGLLPSVAFARTPGKDGSAAMNEDYEAKTTLMPIVIHSTLHYSILKGIKQPILLFLAGVTRTRPQICHPERPQGVEG